MLFHNIKFAWRHIQKYKFNSVINIIGLSVGIASFLLILIWINHEVSFDKFYKNAERIYRVAFYYPPFDVSNYKQPGALPSYLKNHYEEVTLAAHVQEGESKLSYSETGFFEHGYIVEPDFISIFSFHIVKGNPKMLFKDPNSIVLTTSLAKKIFGDEDPMGKMITFNDNQLMSVSGILEDLPVNTHLNLTFLISFNPNSNQWNTWNFKNGDSYVMLSENVDLSDFNKKIYNLLDEFQPDWNNKLFLQPLIKDHLYPVNGKGAITSIYIFSTVAAIILLIACINFMNLTTAQAEKRQKEIGVRKVLGSNRKKLAVQFLVEYLLMIILAAILSILWIELILPVINHQLGLNLEVKLWKLVIPGVGGVILVAGLISGSYPAILLSSLKPHRLFRTGITRTGNPAIIRKILVITQFSLSILFIISVLTIKKQMNYLRTKNLGYNKENLLLVQTRGEMQNKVSIIKQDLLKHHQISSVTVSANNLFDVTNSGPLDYPGKPEGNGAEYVEFWYNWVDEDFIKTLDIPMMEGRFFSKEHPSDLQNSFVVNETAIRKMGLEDPIGQTIKPWFREKGTIIGVVKDYHVRSLQYEITPVVLCYGENQNYLCIRIKPGDLQESIAVIGETIHKVVPDDPYIYHFVDETIEQNYQLEQHASNLMTLSAILVILISALGLFSLAAFTIEKRTKEIGIRKVNGATSLAIMLLLNKEFLGLVVISVILATPLAWYILQKWLRSFEYKTDMSWWIFVVSGGLALLIALITVCYQSIRASIKNPVEVLRYE